MTPLSRQLKERIERETDLLYSTHPLYVMTRKGLYTYSNLSKYIFNLRYIVSRTPTHMLAGLHRAKDLNLPFCADFFEQKIPEEMGHEIWADNDLSSIPLSSSERSALQISPHIRAMDQEILKWATGHPVLYASYALWAEYFTVLISPRWAADLDANCAIPPEKLSILMNHAAIDRDHVDHDLTLIDEWSARISMEQDHLNTSCHEVISRAFALFSAFAQDTLEPTKNEPRAEPELTL